MNHIKCTITELSTELPLQKVDRIEIISDIGRLFVKCENESIINKIVSQDNDRTIKIFLNKNC